MDGNIHVLCRPHQGQDGEISTESLSILSPSPLLPGPPLVVQTLKNLPAMRETRVRFLGQEDPLEKEMATHSSILAWRIPWRGTWRVAVHGVHKESDTTEQLTLSLSIASQASEKIFHDNLNSLLNEVHGAWTCCPESLQSENSKHIYTCQDFTGFGVSVQVKMRWVSKAPERRKHAQVKTSQCLSLKQTNYSSTPLKLEKRRGN